MLDLPCESQKTFPVEAHQILFKENRKSEEP